MTNYNGPQAELPLARALRDDGMGRAIAHAELLTPTWSSVARQHVEAHARKHANFTTEEVRQRAEAAGFPKPPDNRAWGGVIHGATRDGVMSSSGRYVHANDPKCHHRPVVLWQSNLYRGA